MINIYFLAIWIGLCVGFAPVHHHKTQCGRPAYHFHDSKVVGGTPAKRGTWPWMVMLTELAKQVCGGTLINEQVVVTAAHCFEEHPSQDVTRWRAILGGLYAPISRDPMWPSSAIQYRHVMKLIMHEAYDNVSVANDIALLILSNKVHFNDYTSPACLPGTDYSANGGELCYATGWGDTQGTGNETILNQVDLQIINATQCLQKDWLGDDFLPVSTLCAGFEAGQKDTCGGDSGGPLVCKHNGAWFLQGIASWGFKCAVPKWPGVYTNVSAYTNWIHDKLAAEGFLGIMG